MTYRFRVGTRPLGAIAQGALSVVCPKAYTVSHAAFLINTDLFEYGPGGFHRRAGAGRDASFNWDQLGSHLNGTTHVSPDQLDDAIRRSGEWGGGYNVYTHNCHHFVQYCLKAVGAGFFFDGYNQHLMRIFK